MIKEMRMLLWKDFRLSRMCLLTGVILIAIPYAYMLCPLPFWYDFRHAWATSTTISQLTIALVAGNIIACERADRSSSFLAYQGITRKRMATSKLTICLATLICVYAVSLILSIGLNFSRFGDANDIRAAGLVFSSVGVCLFGACWLLSDFMTGSSAAIVFGVLFTFILYCTIGLLNMQFNWFKNVYSLIPCFSVPGLISLVAGTWHFIRSKES